MKSSVMSTPCATTPSSGRIQPPPLPIRRTIPPPLPPRSNSNHSTSSALSGSTSTNSSTSNASIANNPPSSATSDNSSEFSPVSGSPATDVSASAVVSSVTERRPPQRNGSVNTAAAGEEPPYEYEGIYQHQNGSCTVRMPLEGRSGDHRTSIAIGDLPQHSSLCDPHTPTGGSGGVVGMPPSLSSSSPPPLPPLLQQFLDEGAEGGDDGKSNRVEIVSSMPLRHPFGGGGRGGVARQFPVKGGLVNGGGARSKGGAGGKRVAADGGGGEGEKPSVSFDPNLTILHNEEDGRSPIKTASSKDVKNGDGSGRPAPSQGSEDCYLKELYAQVSQVVASNPDERETICEDEAEDPAAVPMVWISKWVDYSDKYGLGYQLCDDSIGVLFNDFTKLQLLPDGENIHYIERNLSEHYHTLTEYPQPLYKKVTLLRYFRNYMNEHLLKAGATMCPREGDELARIPSLRTYFRTRSAIVLHLTNGTLQMNFFEDHTKIILCPLMGAVTYIDQKRNFRTFKLALLQQYGCSVDLASRLKYARNMIQKMMLTRSTGDSAGSATTTSAASGAKENIPTV